MKIVLANTPPVGYSGDMIGTQPIEMDSYYQVRTSPGSRHRVRPSKAVQPKCGCSVVGGFLCKGV